MTKNTLDWTHRAVGIKDIRKLNKLYAIFIDSRSIDTPLFVHERIFEERLQSYFFTQQVTREQIMSVKWNMYITQGYYIKIDENGPVEHKRVGDDSKYYISFLEIDGPLGTFQSVHKP